MVQGGEIRGDLLKFNSVLEDAELSEVSSQSILKTYIDYGYQERIMATHMGSNYEISVTEKWQSRPSSKAKLSKP